MCLTHRDKSIFLLLDKILLKVSNKQLFYSPLAANVAQHGKSCDCRHCTRSAELKLYL